MSIKKRSEIWWVDVTSPSGKRIRRSAGTGNRKEAQEFHDRLKAKLWREGMLGERPERTFEEAALRFLQAADGQKDYPTKARHIKHWRTQFAGRTISSLTTEDIMDALPTHTAKGEKLTPATRNRYLATIGRMLNQCVEWDWIASAPRLRRAKEPKVRIRWLTHKQAQALLDAITLDWMRDVCQFALATGMRASEILGLRWDQVDLRNAWASVGADQTKSGRARAVPLSEDAIDTLRRRLGKDAVLVFTRASGRLITQPDARSFNAACKAAGIEHFRFHDLRHTWASWHVQAGTPLFGLKELGGWETLEMVKKYAHLGADHLASYANNVTFTAQAAKKQKASPARERLSA